MDNNISETQTQVTPMASSQPEIKKDPMEELLEISKNNNELLKILVTNQAMALEMQKDQVKSEKNKRWFSILKYIIYAVLVYYSFIFVQKFTQNTLNDIIGQGIPHDLIGEQDISNINTSDIEEMLNLLQ